MKGILLNNDFDLLIRDGSFVIGEAEISEAGVILGLNQGNLKNDPLLGPDLVKYMRSIDGASKAVAAAKKHLARDGKSYQDMKDRIRFNTK
jgi:hypothetical protein